MSQQRLSNDEFLSHLTQLFTSTHAASHGSVYLTQKPLSSESESPSPSSQILVRATNGLSKPHRTPKTKSSTPKLKIATVVEIADLDSFYARYAEVCKKGMEGLRKRDKKKAKEKAKAKKKGKSGAAP
ncbi:signal recognition particle 14kD protein-domain-containing protein [Exophiala viscosa]|uniref:Signal recognition particle subunit SRP14 n=1 Tax=Exophiala viscosa TaxID=2486360 RepID=A0AAN6DP58_9EURO|nr:signal recognition particle 14kD protein-domain-containing protein [Exophiala viscosa]KAI1625486.1 signal recognition particle 14kD protein-domain-containing protein [Exophiala viscosa]